MLVHSKDKNNNNKNRKIYSPPPTTTMTNQPHVVVCPASGMGHVAPFLSLASGLSSSPFNCTVTLVVVVPFVTAAESDEISSFFSSHPNIHRLDFHVDLAPPKPNVDPFFSRYESISQSAHNLAPHLSALSPPVSATFADFLFTAGLNTTLPHLPNPIPNYTVSTNSARFFSVNAYLPHLAKHFPLPRGEPVEIPSLDPYPFTHIPPPTLLLTTLIVANAQYYPLSKGILLNTFDSFEPETLAGLKSGKSIPDLPPIFPIGPYHCHSTIEKNDDQDEVLPWLDEQPDKSVLYVSFGNRSALPRDQMRELGMGLERSGCRFLWVVKTNLVDKEEKDELQELLGEELHEKLCKKGKMVKRWVSQKSILGHRGVGGFLSHCGWNSVVEAANCGVPILAWPDHGEQRENAGVVVRSGLGVWEREWGWGMGGCEVVGAVEIADKIRFLMGNEELRESAKRVGEEAKMACQVGGSSRATLMNLIVSLKH